MDKRLVDHIVNSGILSRASMQRLILRAKKDKIGIVEQLFTDDADESAIAAMLSEYFNATPVDETEFDVNTTALKFISKRMADKHGVLPFNINKNADHVTVAVFDPESAGTVLETLKTATGSDPTIRIARKSWLTKAIRHYYFGDLWAQKPKSKKVEPPQKPLVSKRGDAPIGRLKPKRRTIITPIHKPAPAPPTEQSAEILLNDIVDSPPRSSPRPTNSRTESQVNTEKLRPRRQSHIGGTPPPVPGSGEDVDQALEDFDQFLSSNSMLGNSSVMDPNLSDIPGWTSPPDDNYTPDPMDSWAGTQPQQPQKRTGNGFDLFDENSEAMSDNNDQVIRQQAKDIAALKKDVAQQQAIIQALVDILSESRIVSKREIKRRMNE